MSLNYLVSDTFSRIQTGLSANLAFVYVLNSTYIKKILDLLYLEGYISGYQFVETELKLRKHFKVFLKYDLFGKPLLQSLKAVSTPGLRKYITVTELIKLRKQRGSLNTVYLISTSQGILTDLQALNENIGGEIVCRIN